MGENLLSATGITKSYGDRTVLSDVTLGIDAGSRIGLIGDNGTGKSTFLRILAGTMAPDAGTVARRQGLKVALLPQVPVLPTGSVRAALGRIFAPVQAAITRYEAAPHGPNSAALLGEIEALGGWDWQHRVERAASSVGLDNIDQPTDQLSGGQQKRVAIAQLLLEEPDLVLLDEPTNHLDTATIEWLEKWLAASRAAAVVVTHDRYFLDAVADRMAEVRLGQLRTYAGNYTDYLVARATEEALDARTQARQLRFLKDEVEWARRSPKARTTKQSARLKRLDEAQERLAAIPEQATLQQLQWGTAPRLGSEILVLDQVSAAYDGRTLFDPFTLRLVAGERWGIVGPNGAGKTSLLSLITGELQPSHGQVTRGVNTQIAYFDQARRDMDPRLSVREILVPEGGDTVYPDGKPMHVSSWLNRFAFPSSAQVLPVSQLSGGERSRLALARLLLQPANLLLLDEPTNDLDLLTLAVLEQALLTYNGCVLVVSHDRYFLDKIATGIVAYVPNGPGAQAPYQLHAIQGGYTHYQGRVAELHAAAAPAAAATTDKPTGVPAPAANVKPLSYQDKRDLETIEQRIEAAENEVARLEAALQDGSIWQNGGAKGQALQAEHTAAQENVQTLYARWEELTTRQEAIAAAKRR